MVGGDDGLNVRGSLRQQLDLINSLDKKRTTILTNPAWSNKTIKHGGEREREKERRDSSSVTEYTGIFVCFKTPTRNTIFFVIFVDLNNITVNVITVNVAVGVWHIGNR